MKLITSSPAVLSQKTEEIEGILGISFVSFVEHSNTSHFGSSNIDYPHAMKTEFCGCLWIKMLLLQVNALHNRAAFQNFHFRVHVFDWRSKMPLYFTWEMVKLMVVFRNIYIYMYNSQEMHICISLGKRSASLCVKKLVLWNRLKVLQVLMLDLFLRLFLFKSSTSFNY